ncbi:MAG TPA: methylated-DNA--[protein]-cysteine S-methyltransferase [Lacunisphaera sp.]|jgi:methylated-DNA-[protein]-cysteine S-methyltransferase
MTYYYDTFSTPTGNFSVTVNDAGALIATAFGGRKNLLGRIKPGHLLVHDESKTRRVRQQVFDYFAGKRKSFDLPLDPEGTVFQRSVWTALQQIPFGETRSYGELAAILKRAGAARAVGRANATNPICLIVPCHRVIGANGSLTGFAFGEDIKEKLLVHERAIQPPTKAAA